MGDALTLREPRGMRAFSGKHCCVQSHLGSTFEVNFVASVTSSPWSLKKISKTYLVLDTSSAPWGGKRFP